jgi:TonB family protein
MRIHHCIACLVLLCAAATCVSVADETKKFDKMLDEASKKSNLTAPGSAPFHLKLSAKETRQNDPQLQADLEIWWAAPDKWRREIKSPAFSQAAVQNGQGYYENNSGDYMPFWLNELIQAAIDPIPLEALKSELQSEQVEFNRRGCAEWQTYFAAEGEQIDQHNEVCFNSDGTVGRFFTRPGSAQLESYQKFQGKWTASSISVWPGGPKDVRGTVYVLEKLKADGDQFAIPKDGGLPSRMRFVLVPQNALDSYKLDSPPMEWPVLHNFPAKGAVTVDLKIDRNGNIREVGSPISHNVIINDAVKAQIAKWKFKPYPNAEAPVQVDTNITLRWDAKMELLGGNGKTTSVSFFERIAKAKEVSDPRTPGSKPFHMRASFDVGLSAPGKYEEVWVSPEKWWRRVELDKVTVVKTRSGDKLYTQVIGSPFIPKRVDEFLDGLDVPFPDTGGSFIEGDWGHSAVTFDGVDTVRVARGRVNDQNEPIDGQAYWFDAAGLLHGAYWDPRMISYGDWAEWNGKRIPRTIELTILKTRVALTTIEQIESPSPIDDALFVLDDVKPEPAQRDVSEPLVQPQVIYRENAVAPASLHGKVVVTVRLDQHGHVVDARVKETGGAELDEAAVKAAMNWEFTPMRIRGLAVPGGATLTFKF